MNKIDTLIIGSGPAGLTAAIYTARAQRTTVVLAGPTQGGQLTKTTDIENFPGVGAINGYTLMSQMQDQAIQNGATVVRDSATEVNLNEKIVKTESGETYNPRTIIITTGSTPRTLQIPGEQEMYGKGVSTCATCDGMFYRDKHVAIVGGGDTAMEEATFLAKFCKKVTVLNRTEKYRASKIMLLRAQGIENIEFKSEAVVKEVLVKDGQFAGIRVNKSGTTRTMKVDGLFLAIGHTPNSELFSELKKTDSGHVLAHNQVITNIDGVFAAGEIVDHRYRQAITSAGLGCMAAIEAEHYLESIK